LTVPASSATFPARREVLEADADRQVVATVAAHVAGGERLREVISVLGAAPDPRRVLCPELAAGRRETRRRAVQYVHRAGLGL
jgi:hypothetical protein